MKNQYFGDINDYRKYGLLRALQSTGDGSLLVAWMLTLDDGGRDGGSRSYLEAPETWSKYDPDLFAGLADLLREASGVDLVFLDPDNGIEVPSKPVGRKGSSKYVTWQEVEEFWKARCSLLIYQHFRGEERDAFARRLTSEIRDRTRACFTEAFRTPHVLFLLVAQDRHAGQVRSAVELLSERWSGQIGAMGLADTYEVSSCQEAE